jgi:hypothetical protein
MVCSERLLRAERESTPLPGKQGATTVSPIDHRLGNSGVASVLALGHVPGCEGSLYLIGSRTAASFVRSWLFLPNTPCLHLNDLLIESMVRIVPVGIGMPFASRTTLS